MVNPNIRNGPKGILEVNFLFFNISEGITNKRPVRDDKKIINGMLYQPNQKPIADNSFASPRPMPSLLRSFL